MSQRGRFHETHGISKFRFTFSGVSDHHVCAESDSGNLPGDSFKQVMIESGSIVSLHRRQDSVIPALERYVQMPADAVAEQTDDPFGDFARLNGTQADPRANSPRGESREHVRQAGALGKLVAIGPNVNTGEYYLGATVLHEAVEFPHHRRRRGAARSAAGQGNDAIGTAVIAAVLYLEK